MNTHKAGLVLSLHPLGDTVWGRKQFCPAAAPCWCDVTSDLVGYSPLCGKGLPKSLGLPWRKGAAMWWHLSVSLLG